MFNLKTNSNSDFNAMVISHFDSFFFPSFEMFLVFHPLFYFLISKDIHSSVNENIQTTSTVLKATDLERLEKVIEKLMQNTDKTKLESMSKLLIPHLDELLTVLK
jgi:hypothetical protein